MSRDSSRSYLHLHASRHADLFEEFTQSNPFPFTPLNATHSHLPTHTTLLHASGTTTNHPSTTPAAHAHVFPPTSTHPTTTTHTGLTPSLSNLTPLAPGHSTHLPPEDIAIPPQYAPPNPEDEDDVVPDQHAAFGITRAMRMREEMRERSWRDFGALGERVRGVGVEGGEEVDGNVNGNVNGRFMAPSRIG